MRKINFSLLLLSLLGISIFAQHPIRITAKRNAYRAADQIVKQQVEFKDPGSSGKKLSWDFSMLQPINEEYTLNYFIPDSTFMEKLCGLEHNTRYYYLQRNDSLWSTGFENFTTYMEYTKPELNMHFPFAYGDTLYSTFEGEGEYCHRLKLAVKGYTRVEADAEGKLQLPDFETVKKALRVHTERYYTETGKDSSEIRLDTYAWYAKGIRYPVFESIKTNRIKKGKRENEQVLDTTVFSTSFYYPPEKQLSQIETDSLPEETEEEATGIEAVFTEANLQPNPVTSNLYITYKLTRPAIVWFTVHTNIGIPVCQTPPQHLPEGYNNTTVKMNHLITGTYTLYVHVDDMVLQKVVIKK